MRAEIDRVQYGAIAAVTGVRLDVDNGEVVTVLGPNGAGKTSLLKAIMGAAPTVGRRIWLDGENHSRTPTWRLTRLGLVFVPDGGRCFPELTVENNLRITAGTDSTAVARVEEIAASFPKLRARWRQEARVLSGGERVMLAIGRGLLLQPRVLILDEPSAGLAPIVVREVYAALDALQTRGTLGVLLAEQNARAAMSVTRRVILMSGGHVIAAGRADSFTTADLEAAYLGKFERRASEARDDGGPDEGAGAAASLPAPQREG